ncbi:hypothetical protein C5E07_00315 [Pseudoclavibacter sp. RFBJ3]|uniref:antitoxin VbhA family protein n=1 Tax=unclassified Pseudoclavibacter TaxID=2615177 RepID=UPI000CE8335F|nr:MULTISPECIES: antitoxin VbhA family protein [unclassified Pseudoclavibacter]PPF86428.1 hypothetical protein C5C12_01525 [Pseudoclavibacter sp. RFBJ5]PPF95160.1 hypothetical protein C5E07_00315 [Pseudoclavibacter sp. RFBJ3]PPF97595.1 hypothetical protein C5C19_10995 [Pseudoclavibacter sp. RFBH5]PPG05474.1 hypothetical protein C5E06_00990 [Pseudoclavibacter sp. RFBI5]PPG22751.1 hypothetical protein C5E13_10945 [Pseudoclavibacter sp. RFBI4]
MAVEFDIQERWPELFAPLSAQQRKIVVNALASSWHEGWVPNREDVENLTDLLRGAIDKAEYDRRVAGAIERTHAHAAAS